MNELDLTKYDAMAVARCENFIRETMGHGIIKTRRAAADFHKKCTAQLIADDVLEGTTSPQAWLAEYRYLRDLTDALYAEVAATIERIDHPAGRP